MKLKTLSLLTLIALSLTAYTSEDTTWEIDTSDEPTIEAESTAPAVVEDMPSTSFDDE